MEGYEWDPKQGLVEKNEIVDYTELTRWEDLEEATNPSISAQLLEFIRNMAAQANQESQAEPQATTQAKTPREPEDTPAPTVTPTKNSADDSMDIDQE